MRMFIRLSAMLLLPAAAQASDGDRAVGLWQNHQNSIHIEAYHCGESMCGRVVWASAKAIADSQKGGTAHLVGTDLFRDFRKDKNGNWHGKVFVPDINKTFSGTSVLVDPNTLKGSGCLMGGMLCKSQLLTRVH